VHLENGKRLEINAENNSFDTPYVSTMKIDGRRRIPDFITYDDISGGAVIDFMMSDRYAK